MAENDSHVKQNRHNPALYSLTQEDRKKTTFYSSADNLHESRGRTFTDPSHDREHQSNGVKHVEVSRYDVKCISQFSVFGCTPANSCQNIFIPPTREDGEFRGSNDDAEEGTSASERGSVALDGGYGWVIVAGAFITAYTVGIKFVGFSVLYVDIAEYFASTKGSVGLIGSLSLCTGNFLAFLYSPLIQRYGCRLLCIIGACISATGFILSSFATSVEFLYVTYGVISGLGGGLLGLTSVVTVQMYFNKRRTLAHGISTCGLSFGGLTCGPLLRLLLDTCGLHGTFLLLGGLYLQNIVVGALYRPLPMRKKRRKSGSNQDGVTEDITNMSHIKDGGENDPNSASQDDVITNTTHPQEDADEDKEMTSLSLTYKEKEEDIISSRSCQKEGKCDSVMRFLKEVFDADLLKDAKGCLMFLTAGLLPFALMTLYAQAYGRAVYIGISPYLAALLVTIQSVGTLSGRLLCSFIGMKTKRRSLLYAGSIFSMSSAVIAITLTTNLVGMAVVGVTGTVSCGFVMTLQTPVLVDLFGVERIARSQAFHNMAAGLGIFFCIPFSGWLFDISQSFFLPYLVCGLIGFLSGGIVLLMVLLNCKENSRGPVPH